MIKIEGLVKKKIHIYETYKNKVMPHGHHIYAKLYAMANSIMCAYPHSYNALTLWKCVFWCFTKCTSVNLPDQETYDKYSNTRPLIVFNAYHLIACCTTHGRLLLNERFFSHL